MALTAWFRPSCAKAPDQIAPEDVCLAAFAQTPANWHCLAVERLNRQQKTGKRTTAVAAICGRSDATRPLHAMLLS